MVVKDDCESLVWVYFLLCRLYVLLTLKLRRLLHDVPPQTFIRPPMTAAFHFTTHVVMLWTGGGSFLCVCWLTQVSVVYFPGCPGAKKTEFLTSVLDALSTDMVHAVTDPASAGRYDMCSSDSD